MELTWKQFRNQNHIRILNESEQIRHYRFYLDALSNELIRQNKGPRIDGFLLQEDLFTILQENNSGIYITTRHA
jgi:hypothetical protein